MSPRYVRLPHQVPEHLREHYGAVAIVAALAGAAVSAVGSYSSASAQSTAAKYNQTVANQNAIAARQQSDVDALQIQRQNEMRRGAAEAMLAKSGVSGGSAGDVMYASDTSGELNRLSTMYKGAVQGVGYQSQAGLFGAEAGFAQTAGMFGMAGSLIGGIGGAARTYSSIRNSTPDWGY